MKNKIVFIHTTNVHASNKTVEHLYNIDVDHLMLL